MLHTTAYLDDFGLEEISEWGVKNEGSVVLRAWVSTFTISLWNEIWLGAEFSVVSSILRSNLKLKIEIEIEN